MIEVFGGQWRFAAAAEEHEAAVSKVVRRKIHLEPAKQQKWAALLGTDAKRLFGKEVTNGEA